MTAWIPALLLLLVAFHQRLRVHRKGQSAWKGGGFGMFSEINRHSVLATLWVEDRSTRKLSPLRLDPRHRWDAGAAPTAKNLIRWGREIFIVRWRCIGDVAYVHTPESLEDPLVLREVNVKHLEIDFDAATGSYSSTLRGSCSVQSGS